MVDNGWQGLATDCGICWCSLLLFFLIIDRWTVAEWGCLLFHPILPQLPRLLSSRCCHTIVLWCSILFSRSFSTLIEQHLDGLRRGHPLFLLFRTIGFGARGITAIKCHIQIEAHSLRSVWHLLHPREHCSLWVSQCQMILSLLKLQGAALDAISVTARANSRLARRVRI